MSNKLFRKKSKSKLAHECSIILRGSIVVVFWVDFLARKMIRHSRDKNMYDMRLQLSRTTEKNKVCTSKIEPKAGNK